jgi:hypothetical protein
MSSLKASWLFHFQPSLVLYNLNYLWLGYPIPLLLITLLHLLLPCSGRHNAKQCILDNLLTLPLLAMHSPKDAKEHPYLLETPQNVGKFALNISKPQPGSIMHTTASENITCALATS